MKKYEISEEALVMNAAAVIACKLTNHLNGKEPFPENELEIARKTITASTEALAILSLLLGGV